MAYFDHAATTPMRQCAIDAWVEHAGAVNPGGQYASGRRANSALTDAREAVAQALGAEPAEVVFVGSGTEADNIAVRGLYRAAVSAGGPRRVVASTIEHPAVRETVLSLEREEGAEVACLPVGRGGAVRDLSALDSPAAVAACMMANNETGAIQPVAEIARRAAEQDTAVHVDAVQAVGKIPVDFHKIGATTLAASAHKFGGPRGAGILLAKRTPAPAPLILGGGQERGLRSGTVDVATAAATAAALTEAVAEMEQERAHVDTLCERLVAGIRASIPDTQVTVQGETLPGHVHVMFPGANGDAMLMLLDAAGIEASTGSACSAGVNRMSHVLEAMGIDTRDGMGALRLTLGRTTTGEDVDMVLRELPRIVERARVAGAL
ncbi:cysteine desulfurase family protein [Corynebacterium sp.]|uniref:cysteine desulfurase family protein n=1 Tax=Corynebacterium sp. TaxID=1720 RepID=UPI002A9201A7|nr:cysteine desulfurase family protein [Corynebacterium sp.]MDY5784749.1 cysteine desulfurase family protein [Corynebacterium sp.]